MAVSTQDDENAKIQRYQKLLYLTQRIHSTLDLDQALEIVLDAALQLTEMQRAFVMLFNSENQLEFRLGRDAKGKTLGLTEFQVSQTVIERTIKQRSFFYFVSPSEVASESVYNLQIGSGLCVPLFSYRSVGKEGEEKKMVGILYEDSKRITNFDKEGEAIASSLALHAGLALENASLYELATLDGLTRVYQRRYFDAVAGLEWERARRHKRGLTLLMIDLDHFKSVNDTYGHAKGDLVLRTAAQAIKGACRLEDIVARYGGDEFAVLLPETDSAGACIVTQRIQDAAHEKVVLENGQRVTLSIGAASHPCCGAKDMTELIRFSDLALYEAKNQGRNRVAFYQPANA